MTDRTHSAETHRRKLLTAMTAGMMATVSGCSGLLGRDTATESRPNSTTSPGSEGTTSPASDDGQREVMLLATSHLALSPENSGGNTFALDAGDVLGADRQAEIQDITDRLAEWEPDRIAVEEAHSRQSDLDAAYAPYRDGNTEQLTETYDRRNEIVQIGFRLADALDHDSVAAVDHEQSLYALLTETEREELTPLSEVLPDLISEAYPLPNPREVIRAEQQRLNEGSLRDHYRRLNAPDSTFVGMTDMIQYAYAFEQAAAGAYTPVKLLTAWHQRNLRIASNIWNVPAADDERVLVVFGASHIPGLQNILTGAPMFAPVSPLPYLEE